MNDKVIIPLCGVDEFMIGFSINGWEIKKLQRSSKERTIYDGFTDEQLYAGIHSLLEIEDSFSIIPFTNDRTDPYYLIFVKETNDTEDFEPIIDVLRVIKSSQFGCWIPIILKKGALLPNGQHQSCLTNDMQFRPLLNLSSQEREQILHLFQMRMEKRFPPIVEKMFSFFHESCRSSNPYLGFILRVTILEMLIDGNAELSYRLKRNVAVFLGRDSEESERIAEDIKAIYNERSKFLHNGDQEKISANSRRLAYEYSRRVIANLLCITDGIDNIRATLEQSGYGENPYYVTM